MGLNGTHQVLVYAEVNMLGKNIMLYIKAQKKLY